MNDMVLNHIRHRVYQAGDMQCKNNNQLNTLRKYEKRRCNF